MQRERWYFGINVFCFTTVFLGAFIAHQDISFYTEKFAVEDGLIEWLTVVFLLFISLLSFWRFFKSKNKNFIFRGCLLFFALLFLFGAGEEISWGQRIFDIESSHFFVKNNAQGETNLHNLVVNGKKINKIIFGTGLGILLAIYFLLFPLLYTKSIKIKNLINRYAIPIPRLSSILWYLILIIIVQTIDHGKKGELLEFAGAVTLALIFLYPKNLKHL